MNAHKAFARMPFDSIPKVPRVSHDFWNYPGQKLAMKSSVLGPLNIHYQVRGKGEPLLLVHGLMTTSYSFRYLAPLLADRYTLFIPDLPGAGRSTMPQDPAYALPAMAQWLTEFQQALGISGCACVANSMGGLISMQAALDHPGVFSHLVNIHAPAFPMMRFYALRAALAVPGASDVLYQLVNLNPLKWAHRNIHYFDETLKSLEEAHEYGDPLASREGCYALYKFLYETLNPAGLSRFVERLKVLQQSGRSFPVPLTMIYSRQDPMVPPVVGTRLARLVPSANMIWLENTSHFAHVDTPEAIQNKVLAALA